MDTSVDTQPTRRTTGFEIFEEDDLPALRVWAPSLPELLEQAARGIFAALELEIQPEPREHHQLVLQAEAPEDLVAGFLSELLYVLERDELCFNEALVQIEGDLLRADLQGGLCVRQGKNLYSIDVEQLRLRATPTGLEIVIRFVP